MVGAAVLWTACVVRSGWCCVGEEGGLCACASGGGGWHQLEVVGAWDCGGLHQEDVAGECGSAPLPWNRGRSIKQGPGGGDMLVYAGDALPWIVVKWSF